MRQQRGTASTVRTVRGLAGTTGEVAGPPAAPGQALAVFVLTEVPGFASGFASGFAGFLPTQVARHPSSRAVLWLEAAPASVLGLSPEACSGDPGYPNRCGSFAWGAPASTGSRGGPTGCAAAPLPRSCSSRHQAPALGDRGQGQGTEASSALAGTTGRGPAWPGVRRELWARGPAADWEPCPSGVI